MPRCFQCDVSADGDGGPRRGWRKFRLELWCDPWRDPRRDCGSMTGLVGQSDPPRAHRPAWLAPKVDGRTQSRPTDAETTPNRPCSCFYSSRHHAHGCARPGAAMWPANMGLEAIAMQRKARGGLPALRLPGSDRRCRLSGRGTTRPTMPLIAPPWHPRPIPRQTEALDRACPCCWRRGQPVVGPSRPYGGMRPPGTCRS